MCYTSGTAGNPKGVVYSHRSSFLHSMAACTLNGVGVGADDRVLPVVPMFHANAWGFPYAALMAGAGLAMPDLPLDAAPLTAPAGPPPATGTGAGPALCTTAH